MERERITISIKKNLLKEIDKTIDGIKVRNRSHAIETLTTSALNLGDTKNAILLLGGKDALKLIPTAKENLKLLKKTGFSTVYVAIGYLGDKIIQKLGDGKELGLELKYIEGEGSGGAIRQLKKNFSKTFVVINTDEVLKLNLEKLIAFHRKHKSVATIATGNLLGLDGVYILEPEIFSHLPNGFSMLESDIFPKLIKEDSVAIYPII
ncbi:MAG: hypothetical protein M1365_14980 [Actinobacteria bacterium]|nr:hypothetical protein [Actinomycetota bacterium]